MHINDKIKDITYSKKTIEYVKRFCDSQLTHGEWEEHKYIAKVKIRDDYWRYFYDEEEYANFLKNSKEEGTFQGLFGVDDIFSLLNNAGNAITNFFSNAWNNLTTTASKIATFIDDTIVKPIASFSQETITNGEDFVNFLFTGQPRNHKYVARIRTASGEYRYFYSDEEYQRYLERQEYQENEPNFMKDVPEYDCEMTMSENMAEVNPNWPYGEAFEAGMEYEDQMEMLYDSMRKLGYDPEDPDDQLAFSQKYYPYTVNCSLCTLAYELRERGYDVEAKPNGRVDDDNYFVDYYDTDTDWISTVYENPQSKSYGEQRFIFDSPAIGTDGEDVNDIIDDMSTEPVGSRGEIAVYFKGGGGHSMAYTVDQNHEVVVRDTQTNDIYTLQEIADMSNYIRYTRTDNLELREECLQYVEYDD